MKKLIEIFLTGNHEQGWLSRIFGGSTLYSDFIDDFLYAQDRADRKKYVYDYVQVPCDTISSPVPHGGLSNALLQWNSMPHNDADILKIRINSHGNSATKGFFMGKDFVDVKLMCSWLRAHGLKHDATDSWKLVICIFTCYGADTAYSMGSTLNRIGLSNFTTTGGTTSLLMGPEGQVVSDRKIRLLSKKLEWKEEQDGETAKKSYYFP